MNIDIAMINAKKYSSEEFNILINFKPKYVILSDIKLHNIIMQKLTNNTKVYLLVQKLMDVRYLN